MGSRRVWVVLASTLGAVLGAAWILWPAGTSTPAPMGTESGPPAGSSAARGESVEVRVRSWLGAPVVGAAVEFLRPAELRIPEVMREGVALDVESGPALGRGLTDGEGRARVGGLPPGRVEIRASAPGWATMDAVRDIRPGIRGTLAEFRLLPGCQIEGVVRRASGAPVAGARVRSSRIGSTAVTTGADGRYLLRDLAPGPQDIVVFIDGRLAFPSGEVLLPSVRTCDLVLPDPCPLRFLVLDGKSGNPLPGAWVRAFVAWDGGEPLLPGMGRRFAMATGETDATGVAAFSGLPAGELLWWWAMKAGVAPAGMGRAEVPVVLAAGRETQVEAILLPGGRIHGVVRTMDGSPLSGVLVRGQIESDGPDAFLHQVECTTGPDGRYVLSGVTPGRWRVWVRVDGYRDARRVYTVPPEGDLERDIVPEKGGVILGTVVDSSGKGVAGVGAFARDSSDVIAFSAGGVHLDSGAASDDEGKFRIEGVPPGREYRVRIPGRGAMRGESEPFRVEDVVHPVSVRVVLPSPASIAGRVRVEGGSVPTGTWVSAEDLASADSPVPDLDGSWCAPVAADGTFRLEGVDPGKWLVRAHAEGFTGAGDARVDLHAGGTAKDVVVVLVPSRLLRGRVVDMEGRPLPGATVRSLWHQPEVPARTQDPLHATIRAVSGPDGRFSVQGLRAEVSDGDTATPVTYELLVGLDGWCPGGSLGRPGGEEVIVSLHRAGTISGVVVEEGTGKPLAGVPLKTRQARGRIGDLRRVAGWTGPDGAFRLEGLVGGGTCDLEVGNDEALDPGTGGRRPVVVEDIAVGTTSLRVALGAGLSITGRVLDEQGNLPEGEVSVRAVLDSPWKGGEVPILCREGPPRADGSFTISGLPAGLFRVTARITGPNGSGNLVPAAVSGVAAGTGGLDLHLQHGDFISGTVVDLFGKSPKDGWVHFGPAGTKFIDMMWEASRLEGGAFRVGPLVAGREYDLVTSSCTGYLSTRVSRIRGGRRDVVITVSRAGWITGRVLDPEGWPAGKGVPVRAIAEENPADPENGYGWVLTGPGGEFTFDNLGPYRFRVYAGGTSPTPDTPDFAPVAAEPVAPGTRGLVVRTRAGNRLAGRLVDGARRAREVSYIIVEQPGLPSFRELSMPEADRTFVLHGLLPGRVVLRGLSRSWEPMTLGTFEVPTTDLVIPVGGK